MSWHLIRHPDAFHIYQLPPSETPALPPTEGDMWFLSRTKDEWTLVLPESVPFEAAKVEKGWHIFQVSGQIPFETIGLLAQLAQALAQAGISIFALSTYDTDYILVKTEQAEAAQKAFMQAGCTVKMA